MATRSNPETGADARQRVEAAQLESEQQVRAICDLALDAVVMIDASGRVVYWNPAAAEMFGYSSDEMLGREVHAVLTPISLRKEALEGFATFKRTGRGRAVNKILELTALRRDGSEFPIEVSVSAFQKSNQWYAVAVIRDATQRKRAQEVLEQEQSRLRHMLEASDHERHLISCEIHDGLAQQLAGAIMQFEAADLLKRDQPEQAAKAYQLALQLVRDSHAEARRLIGGLLPPQLEEGGVVSAIENLVEQVARQTKVHIEFFHNLGDLRLDTLLENSVFRIVQECLTNACRHSKSKKVKITLTQNQGQIRVEVQDWGIGFKLERAHDGHFGLEGIRQRARVFGGCVDIRSEHRKGTDIVVSLPLSGPDSAAGSALAGPKDVRRASHRGSAGKRPR